ncbi:sensor histidine kinase [Hamadaea tsunoensis]|uniref:sensor histidine kinase n=1 Tax=Hamadaea tsunoensis TaxID=53368 RepID=UPI0004096D8E|nr:sensor histidine kinase [Hamadaea tsunoensis]
MLLLRSFWREPAPEPPPGRRVRDLALAGVLLALIALEAWLRTDLAHRAVSVVVTAGLVPTLLWRRSRPALTVAAAFSISALVPLLIDGGKAEMYATAYLLLLPFSLYRWGSGRAMVIGSGLLLASLGFSLGTGHVSLGDSIGGAAVLTAVCALGAALRYRGRARQRELDRMKLLERENLARDLHDTVAHHVSAMAIRAQAGQAVAATRPEAAVEALRLIEAEATRALAELRSMVRVLRRDEPADLSPQPRIRDLERLAGRFGSGPEVRVRLDGDLADLPSAVDTAVYRLVQESLTNARRHARHATRVTVSVTAAEDEVRLRVSDDGEIVPGRRAEPGYGLVGMHERANLLGGVCTAGPGPERGWLVTAALPRKAPAA